MKKPLYIKVNEEGRTMACSVQENKIDNYNFKISDYPSDYIGNEKKYFIKLDSMSEEPYFEENPNWEAELEAMTKDLEENFI